MNLTAALKQYAIDNLGVSKDATDADFRKAISKALVTAKLTTTKFAELSKAPAPKKGTEPPGKKGKTDPEPKGKKGADDTDTAALDALVAAAVKKATDPLTAKLADLDAANAGSKAHTIPTPAAVMAKGTQVRVKSAVENYSDSTKQAHFPEMLGLHGQGGRHPYAGRPATFQGKALSHPSEQTKAIAAAWVKWSATHSNPTGINGLPENLRLTDHDRDLCMYAMHKMAWTGYVGRGDPQRVHGKKLNEFQIKALLDDTVSGGIEATPIVFDEAIILTPVLYGEFFPFLNVVNIGRGRRVKGAQMQNPTFTSGTSEGTPIQPFNTGSFVSAFDTAIHVATGAMEIGLDFEEDSPVDLGSTILQKYGEKSLEWLDRVTCVGNGYDEPLGFMNTVGVTSIQSDAGSGLGPTVSDYEGLMFGIQKQYRNEPGALCVFAGSDTSYRRARAIPVGPADERRVFGMTHADYMLLDKPYKVSADIPNNKVAFVNLKRYRMYRRLGMTVRVETAGRTLALSNTKLLVLRMRFGGQMETANAMSLITDAAN